MKKMILFAVLVITFLYGCEVIREPAAERLVDGAEASEAAASDDSTGGLPEGIKTMADGTKYLVHPSKIIGGGPPKGGIGVDRGIPALDSGNLNFVSVAEASAFIADDELVLVVQHNGEEKVYPLQIMVWHEIANDVVGGDPLAITYCPLCGSGIAYDRRIMADGSLKVARFGTSGKLYNSNLVMYDDLTDTYWQQIDGKAIIGDLAGQELQAVSIDTVVWRDLAGMHPDALVLSQDTGISRAYGRDPYGSYYEDSFLFFPVDNENDSVHPKTVIFGIEVDGVYKAYREDDLVEAEVISDTVNGISLTVKRDSVGIVTVVDAFGNEIVKERDFWFAWYAFHPETELYAPGE
ncbi:MAG: DUF3179 domain-containing protein [Nanoarchaeota archaeon]|nr:DUF3179 domain-containing protein [Nanoarchaeota archaeon]